MKRKDIMKLQEINIVALASIRNHSSSMHQTINYKTKKI